jgi:hypothetical protein
MSEAESPETFRYDATPGGLSGDGDAFGHIDYAAAVASVLMDARAPFTMGLFGPWGVGKTTVIEEIGRQLEGKAAFAYFDAWRYESDALRRQFLRDLAAQLHPHEANFDPETELLDLDRGSALKLEKLSGLNGRAVRETILKSAIAVVIAFVLLQTIGSRQLRDQHGTVRDVVVSGLIGLLLFALTPLTNILRVTEETVTTSRLEDPEHFTQRFGELLRRLKKDRLVVAIDNLDRCSPERVEELLATIKTYLEPASQISKPWLLARVFTEPSTKQALFLIAADDEALRRHLEAKERDASGSADSAAVRRYVDEYLRKFFTSSLRMRPLLDADVRAYAERELAAFCTKRKLDEDTRKALVEMIAAALSRNPRRVKQFANNLESRLRVVEQREAADRIKPPISSNVLVIAKLAVLEEEWPNSYAEVQARPRILDDWHAAVVNGVPIDAPDRSDPSFVRFLSRSRDIRAPNLAAFIRLKQSQEEIRLPRYAEFRDALEVGTTEDVERVIDEQGDRASDYAALLPDILEEELAGSFIDGARAVVEAVTSVPALNQEEAIVRRVLEKAVADPSLRARLVNVRPKPLFLASSVLTPADRILVLNEFTDLSGALAESAERFAQTLDAFATIAESLPSEVERALRGELATAQIASRSDALLSITTARPDLVPVEAANAALAAFAEDLDPHAASFELLRAWLSRSVVPTAIRTGFLTAAGNLVARQQTGLESDATVAADRLRLLVDPIKRLQSAPADAATQFFTTTNIALAGFDREAWDALMDVMSAAATIAPELGAPHAQRLIDDYFAAAPAEAIKYAANATAPGATLEPLLTKLHEVATQDPPDLRRPAIAAMLSLDPEDSKGKFRDVLINSIGRQLFNQVSTLIEENSVLSETHVDDVIELTLSAVRTLTNADTITRALNLLNGLAQRMSDERLDEYRDVLSALLQGADPDIIEAAATAIDGTTRIELFQPRLREIVRAAFEHLKVTTPAPAPALSFVGRHVRLLGRLEQTAFVSYLASLMADVGQRAAALSATAGLKTLEAGDRELLVRAIVNAEIMEPATSYAQRVELLRSARKVALARGNANKVIKERLDELSSGSDDDQAVLAALSS